MKGAKAEHSWVCAIVQILRYNAVQVIKDRLFR